MVNKTKNRSALLISSYQFKDDNLRQLVAPAQNAKDLDKVLEDPAIGDFKVRTMLNETRKRVIMEIEKFFAESKSDDLLLLYYSGHGIRDEKGELYFATIDTNLKMLRTTSVAATLIKELMNRSRSYRQVLIFDCSFGGAITRGMK